MNESPIYFYSKANKYFQFSNFSNHPILINGITYPTNEHYFQAAKYFNTSLNYVQKIVMARTPAEAKRLGGSRKVPIESDWDMKRIDYMRVAVHAKFTQYPELRSLLLSTGNSQLYEDAPNDTFWGIGRDRTGKNWLGRILMDQRKILRQMEGR